MNPDEIKRLFIKIWLLCLINEALWSTLKRQPSKDIFIIAWAMLIQ